MSNSINNFLARRKEEQNPKKKSGTGQGFMTKDEKKRKYFAPKAEKENFRVIVPAATGNHYEEAFFHEISLNGGPPQQFYCLHHNDGKPCPLCEEQARLKALSKAEAFGSDESNVLFKASREYEPRKFYIFKGISRGHLSDGIKFWRIKQNFKKTGAMDKLDAEIADIQIRTIEQAKSTGSGTYREISAIKLVGPKKLDEDDAEIEKLVNDSMTWKDIYTPIAINGHLNEYEFLKAVVEGRAPFWDKAQSKWILTGEDGVQYPAEYQRQAEGGAGSEAPAAAAPAPVAEAPAAAAEAPAKKAPAKKSVVSNDDSDLPF